MKNKSHQLINYKGKYITINELADISGKTYGTIASRIKRYPKHNGEQIIAHQTRKQATYKGVTKSIVEWADQFEIATGTLRIRSYQIGIEKAIEFYATNKHLETKKKKYKEKNAKIDNADISEFEFDLALHAERLLAHGFSYLQVANRMKDAGLLS